MTPKEIMKKYKCWAVVGVTTDEDKYGYKIYKRLKEKGYSVYPVNPNYDTIDEDKVYKNILELPEKPDVVNFVVNPMIGIKIVEQCAKLGIKHIWLQPGTVSDELLQCARENDMFSTQACVLVVANYL